MPTPTLGPTLNLPIRLDLGRIPNGITDPVLYRELLRIHDAIERLAVGFTEIGEGEALEHQHTHSNLLSLGADDHPQYHTDARGDLRYVNLSGDTMTGRLNVPGISYNFTAGDTINTGNVCYLDPTGRMSLANANSESTSSTLLAISLEDKTVGQTGEFLLHGVYNSPAHGFTVGSKIFVGLTNGVLVDAAYAVEGNILRTVGCAISVNELYIEPDKTWTEWGFGT